MMRAAKPKCRPGPKRGGFRGQTAAIGLVKQSSGVSSAQVVKYTWPANSLENFQEKRPENNLAEDSPENACEKMSSLIAVLAHFLRSF